MKKLDTSSNTKRNVLSGIMMKIVTLVVPFFVRTAMIYSLGIEYVGLNSLFTSILQVLNMSELGVGIAMTYSMYKPIADRDDDKICALMSLYRKYYRIIAVVILFSGLCLLPFLNHFISGEVPKGINIYIIYILNLLASSMSYLLYAYKNSILTAHQRNDISNKVTTIIGLIMYLLQIITIVIFENYYYYLILVILTQILINIFCAVISNKLYPQYKAKGTLEKKEIRAINIKIRDLFITKVAATIQNSFDFIIISGFLGLTILAKYNNYYFIMMSVYGFITILFNSILAGVGNKIITEDKEVVYADFKYLTFLTVWIGTVCCVCFLVLFQPFVSLWIGDSNLLPFEVVICIIVNFYVLLLNQMFVVYKDASGIWHRDRIRPIISAGTNLLLNLLTVNYLGLYGVLLSTTISISLIGMPWMIYNIFDELFINKPWKFMISLVQKTIITLLIAITIYMICKQVGLHGWSEIIVKLAICIVLSNVMLFFTYRRTDEFGKVKTLLNRKRK